MFDTERLAAIEGRLRSAAVTYLPDRFAVRLYSDGREYFLDRFVHDIPDERVEPPDDLGMELWDIDFDAPLMNAAGMFKDGRGYETVARQGAGAYLAGTVTPEAREGNRKDSIDTPFVPLPGSRSALNWLGLPNDGYDRVAQRIEEIDKYDGCPVGVSVASDPGKDDYQGLVEGLRRMTDAGADFLEINESCPNTAEAGDDLDTRLGAIAEEYLEAHLDPVPVVVKFSNDTAPSEVPDLLDMLFSHGFHGINFGNTSDRYDEHREAIDAAERDVYDYFTETFGGGISGRPLRDRSLELASHAEEYRRANDPGYAFHVFRTGGVASAEDVQDSIENGIAMNQWYTGYFEGFSDDGHDVYREVYREVTGED